jgi:hypothetical protein
VTTHSLRAEDTRIGYKASAEQFAPRELLEFSAEAEDRGLDLVAVSDHFQPWRHHGGHAPNALAWLGALGQATSRVGKGFLLALHLGQLKDAGKIRPEQVSLGKLNNVREAIAIARECRTILGGSGITLEYPVLRHANNLESVLTYEGTSEMHSLIVGQALTGLPAFRG